MIRCYNSLRIARRPVCREYSGPRNSQNLSLRPVPGFGVFASAGALVVGVQVLSRQPGNSKCISRGVEQHARHCIPTETDHQISGAALSQRVNRRQVDIRQQGFKLRQRQSSYQLDSVIDWKIIPGKAKTTGIVNSQAFPSTLRRFYDLEVGCHEAD